MREAPMIEAIRQRCEKATQGPWKWVDDYDWREHASHSFEANDCENFDAGRMRLVGDGEVLTEWASYADDAGLQVNRDDAAFIAHARTDIPYLLDRLAQIEAAFKALIAVTAELAKNEALDSGCEYHEPTYITNAKQAFTAQGGHDG